ncbi:DUF4231 domain-containing protein [bacterium]|nr:MAG: DUF4231 domain-containing protein [bacterium]
MDKEQFSKFIEERYNKETNWYDHKAQKYKTYYTRFQFSVIILSTLTPVIISQESNMSRSGEFDYWKLVAISLSTAVAIITTLLKTFKFHETWINYRTTCETLRKEIHLYNASVGEYGRTAEKEKLFVERVESLISRENTLWLSISRTEKENKN